MEKSRLQQFEYLQEELLTAAELRRLLADKATFDGFTKMHQEDLEKAYGTNFESAFRKDIQEKLHNINRFTYLNSLEGTFHGDISSRIKKMGKGVRDQVEILLNDHSIVDLSQEEWDVIRSAPKQLVNEGMFDISSALVDKYEKVVQEEVRFQLKNISALDADLTKLDLSDETVQTRLKEHFLRATSLVGIMKKFGKPDAQTSSPTLEDRYLEAHMFDSLIKDVRNGKDISKAIEQIDEVYQALQSDLEGENQNHKALHQIYEQMKGEARQNLFEQMSAFTQQHSSSLAPGEVISLMSSDEIFESGQTYAQLITGALNDIKGFEFEQFLMEFSDLSQEEKKKRTQKLDQEQEKLTNQIKGWVERFQYKDSKPSKLVDELPGHLASTPEKRQIRYIAEIYDNEETGQELRDKIAALQSNEDTQDLIKSYRERTRNELMEKLGRSEEDIKKYLESHPRANIFVFHNNHKVYEAKQEDKQQSEKEMPAADVRAIQSELQVLEEISATMEEEGTMPQESIEAYNKALQEIFFIAGVPRNHFQKQGKDFFTKKQPPFIIDLLAKIPPFEKAQINYYQEHHPNRVLVNLKVMNDHFGKTLELTDKDLDVSSSKNLKEFFSTFLKEYNTVKGVHIPGSNTNTIGRYYKKMSALMTLDHPLTAMRFMTNKQLFMMGSTPLYNNHDVDDMSFKPATFQERSADLMKKLMRAIETKDILHMGMLMQTIGNSLISDIEWFPLEKLKDQQETNSLMKTVQNYHPGSFPEYDVESDDQKRYEDDFQDNYPDLTDLQTALIDDDCYSDTFVSGAEAAEAAQRNEIPGGQLLNADEFLAALRSQASHSSTAGAGATRIDTTLDHYQQHLRDNFESKNEVLKGHVDEYGVTMGHVRHYVPKASNWMYTRAKHYPVGAFLQYVDQFSKNTTFISPMSLFTLVQKAWENITQRTDFFVEMHANQLGQNIFKGTFMEPEFAKNYQDNENSRVSFYKDAMGDFGHQQVWERMFHPSDQFEFKAAVEELFENRGYCNVDALLYPEVIAKINEYSTEHVPTGFTRDQILNDEKISNFMYQKLGAAIDQLWGDGTFQNLRNKATSTFDSKKNEYKSSAETMTGVEKAQKLEFIWQGLQSEKGMKELRDMHPAEMYGVIEWEMLEGGQDAGVTFGLMQALIIKGIIPSNLVRKLQNAHSNDLPSFTIMEPMQAHYAGLDDRLEECLKEGGDLGSNKFIKFFDGGSTMKLRAKRSNGKWAFPKTRDDFEASKKNGELEYAHMTIHEVQLAGRQAQVNYHREMDNSCIHVFSPAYNWTEIEQGLTRDTNGVINARPHDICAAYRGVQDRFVAQMNHLESVEDQLDFDRTCYYAYKMIALTCGYASYLSRTPSKTRDYELHKDGSINYNRPYTDKFDRSGSTNYERLILGNSGSSMRLHQSQNLMDSSEGVGGGLRKAMKTMAGYQFVPSMGVGEDGKKDPRDGVIAYSKEEYSPADHFEETIRQFEAQVKRLARKQGLKANMFESSEEHPDAGLKNLKAADRMTKMDRWVANVAKLQ